jgi:hypothetical protein
VETTNATLGGTITNETITELPLNGRNFANLLQLRPGVTIYPGGSGWTQSSNGMRAKDNVYLVDGIYSSEPWMGQSVMNAVGAAGDAGTILSIDSIDEFKTEQNPRAQYGWKPGSIVNVGLKSGTNAIHGTAFAFGRDGNWDPLNYFQAAGANGGTAAPKTPVQLEQFGGTVGGPIIKDKLFWFAAYEGQRYTIGATGQITEPITAAGRARSAPSHVIELSSGAFHWQEMRSSPGRQRERRPGAPGPRGCSPGQAAPAYGRVAQV